MTCLTRLFHYAGLWAADSVFRKGLEKKKKKREKAEKEKFLFFILFTGHFSVGSVAITLKTILHTLVKGVFASLWQPIRMRARWWSRPTHWPHSLSLSSVLACSFWDTRTYGGRDSCLLIIIMLQRKHSATCAWASLAVFIPRVSCSIVKQHYQLLQLHFSKTGPVHTENNFAACLGSSDQRPYACKI